MKSLYERLGGHDVIAEVVKDYLRRNREDPKFARFGTGRSSDTKAKAIQLNIDYMCYVTGGSNYYLGRDMKTSHAGLGITHAEWETNMRHIAEAFDKYKIPKCERDEFIALVERIEKVIVEK